MRRAPMLSVLAVLLLIFALGATPVLARPAGPAVYPPNARVQGVTLVDLAEAWADWAWQPEAVNPLLNPRCEASGIRNIWFAPVSIGEAQELDCTLPAGAKLLVTPGGYECSTAEGNGETLEELIECAETNFANEICCGELVVDGVPLEDLGPYTLTTRGQTLSGPNLFGDDPTLSVERGWYILLRPMSVGEHEIFIYDEAPNFDLIFSTTMHVTVVP